MVKIKCAEFHGLERDSLQRLSLFQDLEVLYLVGIKNDYTKFIDLPVSLKFLYIDGPDEYFETDKKIKLKMRKQLFKKTLDDKISQLKIPFACDILFRMIFYININPYVITYDSRDKDYKYCSKEGKDFESNSYHSMSKMYYTEYEVWNNDKYSRGELFERLCHIATN